MDSTALDVLDEARRNYAQLGFGSTPIVSLGERNHAVATRAGSIKTTTLALALRRYHLIVEQHDGFLLVTQQRDDDKGVFQALEAIQLCGHEDIVSDSETLIFEKYHWCLSRGLLRLDALSSRINVPALPELCRVLLQS